MNKNFTKVNKRKQNNNFNRLKLLTSQRRGYPDVFLPDNKRMKFSNVPYMNTRSVTKKMYNIGATYHAPNVNDEIQWKEWPVHGMHERPIFHPQIGLGTEFFGHKFKSLDGLVYKEISQSVSEIGKNLDYFQLLKRKTYSKNNIGTRSTAEDSFENCMHNSFHSVLAYSAQIVTPHYRKIFDEIMKKKNPDSVQASTSNNSSSIKSSEINSNYLQKLNVNYSQNKPKTQQVKPPLSFKCIKNHAKLQQVLERGSKNTLILLKTSDPNLKKENNCGLSSTKTENTKNSVMSIKLTNNIKNDTFVDKKKTYSSNKEPYMENTSVSQIVQKQCNNKEQLDGKCIADGLDENCKAKLIKDESNINENWLQELIEDTAILYCAAVGVHQDDLVNYLNNLDSSQCMNWFNY